MKLLSTNFRGLGGQAKIVSLKQLMEKENTNLVLFKKIMDSRVSIIPKLNSVLKD
jgi:hypothetical protein